MHFYLISILILTFFGSIFAYFPLNYYDIFSLYTIEKKDTLGYSLKYQPFNKKQIDINTLSDYEKTLYQYYNNLTNYNRIYLDILGINIFYPDSIDYKYISTLRYEDSLFSASLGYIIDSRFYERYYPWVKDRPVRARMYDSRFVLKYNDFNIGIKREDYNIGYPLEYSMLFSNNPYSYDRFFISYVNNFFNFEVFTALLNPLYSKDSIYYYRRVYGKYINLRLKYDRILLVPGFKEGFVVARTSDMVEYRDLYPFSFWFLNMMNRENKGNAIISFDLLLKYINLFNYYISFTIDDWQIDNKTIGDTEPNLYGLEMFFDFFLNRNLSIGVRYKRITPWMYNVWYLEERYTYYNLSLGTPRNNSLLYGIYLNYDYKKIRFYFDFYVEKNGWNNILYKMENYYYWLGYPEEYPLVYGNMAIEEVYNYSFYIKYLYYLKLEFAYRNIYNKDNIYNNNIKGINVSLTTYLKMFYNIKKDKLW